MGDRTRSVRRGIAAAALVVAAASALPASALAGSSPVTVTSVAPPAIGQGASRSVVVGGTGFTSGTPTVAVSGTGVTVADVVVSSATQLEAELTAAASAPTGPRALTVTIGAQIGSLSGAVTVDAAPTIAALSPPDVARTGARQHVVLSGTGFERGMHVALGGGGVGVQATDVTSPTTALLTVTASRSAALTIRAATVTNPDGGRATDATAFTVTPVPAATAVQIPTLNEDEIGVATLTGTNLIGGATISAGKGVSAAVTSATPTTLVFAVTVAAHATVGERRVTVRDGGVVVLTSHLRLAYQPVFVRWAVGDGATKWGTTLARPTFATLPVISFSGTGVTVATHALDASGHLGIQLTVAGSAAPTWRTMTIQEGATTWIVPRALKVRLPPIITSFPSLPEGTAYRTVEVKGRHFEVCAEKDPKVSVSGGGVTVNMASTALGFLMYVNVSVASNAATGARNVTMTNCDSGGTATSMGVFTVTS